MRPLAVLLALAALLAASPAPAPATPGAPGVPEAPPGVPEAPPGAPAGQAGALAHVTGGALRLADLGEAVGPAMELVPRAPGTVSRLPLVYGPFAIPPGWDLNRFHLDVPLHDGFVTQLAWRLVDSATGEPYDNMQVHIHHALWFEHVEDGLLDFDNLVLGTGEEVTAYDLDARSPPGGPRYGLAFPGQQAHSLMVMLHNKQQAARVVDLVLDVTWVHGSAAAIAAAQACDNAVPLPGEGCAAGQEFRGLDGRLWGAIFNVPRQANGPGTYQYPSNANPKAISYAAQRSGTMVFAQGHLHVNGMVDVIVNLGSDAQPCGDLDQDGFPGITLLRSDKFDRTPGSWPHSEDFQMGVTPVGFRAPVRADDRIAQFGVYANRDYASYQAMAFAAMHIDPDEAPAPRAGPCTLANTGPRLVGAAGSPVQSVPNRPWTGLPLPVCGVPGSPPCDHAPDVPAGGLAVDQVVISGFAFLPGDQHLFGPLGAPPKVPAGERLQFVNADTGAVVRHTVTSCAWPCNGHHTANYPQPDGVFESDRLGNLDLFDGGSIPMNANDDPLWETPANLAPGMYSYYCRLHPFMRGWFEVVA